MKTLTAMNRLSLTATRLTLVAVGTCGTVTAAQAVELITNGGFETGNFTGWTVSRQPGSNSPQGFFAASGNTTPLSGFLTVGPAGGSFYAVSDQTGPGAYSLTQTFTVPGAASSVVLSFRQFVNDWSGVGPIVNPAGLDFNAFPNQHARVDILRAGSNPFSTAPADVLGNFYLGNDPRASNPNPYTAYNFDITSLVGGGGSFILRFAEVDNQGFFNQGVDNVSINFTPATSTVPEPSSVLGLLGLGTLGVISSVKRFRK
ncbi:PEP-CTERM sorting domain-containing protein [Pannus brasiliensis CCIBt3594]|uniref:PEP-CTERM sorting domain-containing protein n=1 Tax=Pannus brasiliensis CCIBt3594 TaxID=1427578 RepID=A0AAW9QT66_9CHRO